MQNFIYHMPVKVYFEEGGVKKYLSKEMKKESRKYTADRIGIEIINLIILQSWIAIQSRR